MSLSADGNKSNVHVGPPSLASPGQIVTNDCHRLDCDTNPCYLDHVETLTIPEKQWDLTTA